MSQSLAKLSTHLIFSTKNRVPLIAPDFAPQLYAYMAQVFRTYDSPSIYKVKFDERYVWE